VLGQAGAKSGRVGITLGTR